MNIPDFHPAQQARNSSASTQAASPHAASGGAPGSILCLDIGSGTQDVLLTMPGLNPENWPRFVLPTPARRVAKRIAELTAEGRHIWLHGENMGGGFFGAVKAHVAAGLRMAAHPDAALALHDNPERVRALGVDIAESCPAGFAPVRLADYEPGFWRALLDTCGLPQPHLVVAAAQDHGHHPQGSNTVGRFELWRDFLNNSSDGQPGDGQAGANPASLIYDVPPAQFTRLSTLQRAIGGGPVADTGAAAVLGALALPEVQARSAREGVLVVNAGNSHTIAFLVFRQRVWGVYEHHTGMLTTESLLHDLNEFRLCWLPDEQVRAAGGHGSAFAPDIPPETEGFRPAFVLGPRREMLRGHGQFIAPHGDMMLAGCHGLLHGLDLRVRA
ncbi:DUF1786 domain-containing protein [Nitratidesulfovibrio liaohensis]|uniref:DUF1786 domain-containing protein n=1 Tax=Nitratidesulfovibrio liaohensis TaxID=2604158 RepID=UPI001AAEBC55|nr:DUF1786 domain-containing protein [Nitratidesulfovibrio liaohensis]NHZ46833.1 hypothetical protein [Nitratidesulfovibrio liaohensis]